MSLVQSTYPLRELVLPNAIQFGSGASDPLDDVWLSGDQTETPDSHVPLDLLYVEEALKGKVGVTEFPGSEQENGIPTNHLQDEWLLAPEDEVLEHLDADPCHGSIPVDDFTEESNARLFNLGLVRLYDALRAAPGFKQESARDVSAVESSMFPPVSLSLSDGEDGSREEYSGPYTRSAARLRGSKEASFQGPRDDTA